ncbi:hypothetical protein PPYC2_21745 [Paenibacillus polymyxa]|uniref:hypothetical protein n=1 Tax=Paenibacillus polymyxa TaxID=1406 RepID=UPI0008FBAF39|nr:hypothetical protein [Paenibacillus polymyxa]APB77409.1 hypothetical protein PPYC2_21745 [Paenibacillus polymyxa]
MDMNLIINNQLAALNEEGYVEKIIRKQLEETIKDVVEDSLRSWSDFGKGLKETVKGQLQINLDKLDIPSYNQVILNVIKGEIERSIHEEGTARIQEQLQELLGTGKNEYRLSELVKEMVEDELKLEELSYEEVEQITVIVEEKYGTKYVYMDPKEDVEWYQCKYKISLEKDMTVSRAEVSDKKFDNRVIMGGMYGLDATLFKMWTQKATLVIDDYETEFGNPEFE